MTHHKTTTPSNQSSGGNNLFILFCAPSHDDLTEYTSKLLKNSRSLGAPAAVSTFTQPLKYDQLLTQHSINPDEMDVALIFCGHGTASALQGPGAQPGAANYKKARSPFYDASHLHLGPKFMLAFCCYAARGIGNLYERKTGERTFIGFDEKIYFVMGDGIYANWWRKIVLGTAAAMLNAPNLTTMEKAVRRLYKAALAAFPPEKDKQQDEWTLLMRMYLRKQLEDITFIQT